MKGILYQDQRVQQRTFFHSASSPIAIDKQASSLEPLFAKMQNFCQWSTIKRKDFE
jgi:hypothetical protein